MQDTRNDIPIPGVSTGLAWTSSGGRLLLIESILIRGNGKLTITGNLGDVMRESVKMAVSIVKSMFPDKAYLFSENDLHVHFPEGAIPKDGPSAGIAIVAALSSLIEGKTVDTKLAMTGEVTLRGAVMPIGGLTEKISAARRSGIKKVLIPKGNISDLQAVPEEIKSGLEIIPVSRIEEVLQETGLRICNLRGCRPKPLDEGAI